MAKFGRRNPNNAMRSKDKQRSLHKDKKIRFDPPKHRTNIHNSQYLKVDWNNNVPEYEDEYEDE